MAAKKNSEQRKWRTPSGVSLDSTGDLGMPTAHASDDSLRTSPAGIPPVKEAPRLTSDSDTNEKGRIVELVVRAGQGDEDAWHELYEKYFHIVYVLALATLNNAKLAEEVVQDTFKKVFVFLKNGGEIRHFRAFLLQVARNTALSLRRRESIRKCSRLEGGDGEIESSNEPRDPHTRKPLEDLMHEETNDQIRREVEKLRPIFRDVIRMSFYGQLSDDEIAAALGILRGNVALRRSRGLTLLRKRVEGSDGE